MYGKKERKKRKKEKKKSMEKNEQLPAMEHLQKRHF